MVWLRHWYPKIGEIEEDERGLVYDKEGNLIGYIDENYDLVLSPSHRRIKYDPKTYRFLGEKPKIEWPHL